jgi:hypothetical protein
VFARGVSSQNKRPFQAGDRVLLAERACLGNAAREQARFRRLRASYTAAFGAWSLQVRSLQAMEACSTAGSAALQEARTRAANAQAACRDSRDLLADFLLARLPRTRTAGRRALRQPG